MSCQSRKLIYYMEGNLYQGMLSRCFECRVPAALAYNSLDIQLGIYDVIVIPAGLF